MYLRIIRWRVQVESTNDVDKFFHSHLFSCSLTKCLLCRVPKCENIKRSSEVCILTKANGYVASNCTFLWHNLLRTPGSYRYWTPYCSAFTCHTTCGFVRYETLSHEPINTSLACFPSWPFQSPHVPCSYPLSTVEPTDHLSRKYGIQTTDEHPNSYFSVSSNC
jgi:hypothetical protein